MTRTLCALVAAAFALTSLEASAEEPAAKPSAVTAPKIAKPGTKKPRRTGGKKGKKSSGGTTTQPPK